MTLPQLDTFSATLPELRAKRADLLVQINQIKAQCAIIRARMQKEPSSGNEHETRLAKLLGKTPVAVRLPDDQQLKTLLAELETLNAGVSVLDKEIQNETRKANGKLIESVTPEITRLGTRFAKAFADLHAAHLDFDVYVDSLEEVGASIGQFRVRPNGLSHPKDLSGAYAYGIAEFIDAGFFSKSNMPKVLR